jgi:hypothetical protein
MAPTSQKDAEITEKPSDRRYEREARMESIGNVPREGGPKCFRTGDTGGEPLLPRKFDARGLISRGLEQKGAFFAPFLTLNYFDFS